MTVPAMAVVRTASAGVIRCTLEMTVAGRAHATTFAQGVGSASTTTVYAIRFLQVWTALSHGALEIAHREVTA